MYETEFDMKSSLASCTAALILLAGASAIAQDSLWTARAGTIFLHRTNSSAPLVVNAGGATTFSASQLDFNTEFGFEGVLTRQASNGNALEFRYFQIDGWKSAGTQSFAFNDGLATNPPTPLLVAGSLTAVYQSELHSGEVNLILPISSWLNMSAGFRWVEIDELLQQTISYPALGTLDFGIDTDNHLYGFQLGADGLLISRGSLDINIFAKGGIFANVADQNTIFRNNIVPELFTPGISNTDVAFLSELGVSTTLYLNSTWSIAAGYQAMWIEGVALAPDQIPNMSNRAAGFAPSRLDMSGIFYQGGFISLVGTL